MTFTQVMGWVSSWDNLNPDFPECREISAFLIRRSQAWGHGGMWINSRWTWYCGSWVRWIPFRERAHGVLTWDGSWAWRWPTGHSDSQVESWRALETGIQGDDKSRLQEGWLFDSRYQTVSLRSPHKAVQPRPVAISQRKVPKGRGILWTASA